VRLAGKVALISGAARGQGEAEARLFAREGASVVVSDILVEQGERVARRIVDDGGRAAFVRLDVRSEGHWARAVELAERTFGRLDVLVNNAGILGRPGILDTSLDLWERVVAVNQTGPFLGMRAVIPAMRRAGGGSIVNISSALAVVGYGESASYTAAKGALSALTRTVAVELAAERIRVNVVHPGVIETPMVDDAMGDDEVARAAQKDVAPMHRIGVAAEVAAAVLYLASDESSFVTGAALAVDGGLTVW
jgi:NAD(P)-dependent dehydrogenase (short-subunit alcohol dehydrogenase family)